MPSSGPWPSSHRQFRRNRRANRFQPTPLRTEQLEPRLAMATDVTVSLTEGVLRIEGTTADDAILIRQSGSAVAVDHSSGSNVVGRISFPSGVQKIEVFGGDGRDLIVLHVGTLAASTVIDSGAGADLVVSQLPIDLRRPSGRDLFVRVLDPALPEGLAVTTQRTEKPNLAHEAVYSGQSLVASRTWTGDGRHVEISFDADGAIYRTTSLGQHLILEEAWNPTGSHLRTVNDRDGTVLRETFEDGSLRIEERQRDDKVIRTAWDVDGHTIRQSVDGDRLLLEEAWDPQGGYRRTWGDESGRLVEEVFEGERLRLRSITRGHRRERGAWDDAGNRVREVLLSGVLVRLDQWDTAGVRRTTRYQDGAPVSRETFDGTTLLQQEAWVADRLVRTAWNASGDRIVQTLVGEATIREEEIRKTGERRVTEWAGAETTRTTTDAVGNVAVEKSAGDRLLSRELRSVGGGVQRTTFDPVTGQPATEERVSVDGREIQRTSWSPEQVLRLSLRDGVIVQRERWRDGGLRRISDDGRGTLRVERFTGSDRATLAEGIQASDIVTTASGEKLETIWYPEGAREFTGSKNGVVVLHEWQSSINLTRFIYGQDGSTQAELFENGERRVINSLADGTWREQRFSSSGEMVYEYLLNSTGASEETTWGAGGGHYGAGESVTRLYRTGSGANDVRMRTVSEQGLELRQVWRGGGSLPGGNTTYLEQRDATLNWWGGPLGPNDVTREIEFYDAGRLVYHQRTRKNGANEVLTNLPSAAWDQARQGSYFGLTGGSVFSLVPGGGGFNLFEVGGYLGDRAAALRAGRDKVVGAVETSLQPLQQAVDNLRGIFSGIQSVSHALDVNFRTIQGDLRKVLGSIDFGVLAFPRLETVRFPSIDFVQRAAEQWWSLDIQFTNPFAAIDVGGLLPGRWWGDFEQYAGEKWNTFLDWCAKVDPFAALGRFIDREGEAIAERWLRSPKKDEVLIQSPANPYVEAGYTQEQAELLYDLLDRVAADSGGVPIGLSGRFLQEFNTFLVEEGQRVYRLHLAADGPELGPAGHAGLQRTAAQRAQERLLARYGLYPDGTRVPVNPANPGLNLGAEPPPYEVAPYDESDARRYETPDGTVRWDFDPEPISPSPGGDAPQHPAGQQPQPWRQAPQAPSDSLSEAQKAAQAMQTAERARQTAAARQARIAVTLERVRQGFPAALNRTTADHREVYARGKGREVADFHDSVEQTIRIGGAFAAGLGEGATAAVEGLAKTVVAALDADTWRGLAAIVRQQGRNFMRAEDKVRFVTDLGEQAATALENAVVASVTEWEQASPEGRARLLGRLAGQIATETVVTGVVTRIAGRAVDATTFGRKTKAAVDRVTETKEFPDYEQRVKAAVGQDEPELNSLLEGHRRSTAQTLATQLRLQAGMDPEHARILSLFAKERKQLIVVRSTNPNSLQWHGKPGHAAKPGDLKLKTNPESGLVTATKTADGTLVDARGDVVDGYKVDDQGWIVNTKELTEGQPTRTNYRLDEGHVVDAEGTRFFGDYDLLSVDVEPLNGPAWQMVRTGDQTTGPGPIIADLNRAIVGDDRSRDMFKHGANRENLVKDAKGIYQIETPEIGDTFTVFDSDGTIFIADRLYVRRLLEGRGIATDDVVPPLPNPLPDVF